MKRKKRSESGFYKYAVPLTMFVSTAASVLLWSYSTELFGDRFRGFADSGRFKEVFGAFFGEPALLLTVLGVLFLNFAAFAFVYRAVKDKKRGAPLLLVLNLVSFAASVAIIANAMIALAA